MKMISKSRYIYLPLGGGAPQGAGDAPSAGGFEKQYEQWKASAEQINVAVHDIRHMLARVEALAEKRHVELPDLKEVERAVDRFTHRYAPEAMCWMSCCTI